MKTEDDLKKQIIVTKKGAYDSVRAVWGGRNVGGLHGMGGAKFSQFIEEGSEKKSCRSFEGGKGESEREFRVQKEKLSFNLGGVRYLKRLGYCS